VCAIEIKNNTSTRKSGACYTKHRTSKPYKDADNKYTQHKTSTNRGKNDSHYLFHLPNLQNTHFFLQRNLCHTVLLRAIHYFCSAVKLFLNKYAIRRAVNTNTTTIPQKSHATGKNTPNTKLAITPYATNGHTSPHCDT
jgi:hypothetical protein